MVQHTVEKAVHEEKSMAALAEILRERGIAVIWTDDSDEKVNVIQFRAPSQYHAFEIADIVDAQHGYPPYGLRGHWDYAFGSRQPPIWEMAFSTSSLK